MWIMSQDNIVLIFNNIFHFEIFTDVTLVSLLQFTLDVLMDLNILDPFGLQENPLDVNKHTSKTCLARYSTTLC